MGNFSYNTARTRTERVFIRLLLLLLILLIMGIPYVPKLAFSTPNAGSPIYPTRLVLFEAFMRST